MTTKIIRIKGGARADVRKALQQWIDLYSDNLPDNFQLQLYKGKTADHVVEADSRIDNDSFFYLVNYLNYPEDIHYTVNIEGFIRGESRKLKDQNLLIYIPATDDEYDNVFAVTQDGKHYKIGFDGKIREVAGSKKFASPPDESLSDPLKMKVSEKKAPNETASIQKRFKIISRIALIALIANLMIPSFWHDIGLFEQTSWSVFFAITLWFIMDYEMLQSDSLYLKCLLIAIGVFLYGYFLHHSHMYLTPISKSAITISLCPLTFLLIQWPTRKLYIELFNREPKIESRGKFADSVYTALLLITSIILPFQVIDYLL